MKVPPLAMPIHQTSLMIAKPQTIGQVDAPDAEPSEEQVIPRGDDQRPTANAGRDHDPAATARGASGWNGTNAR